MQRETKIHQESGHNLTTTSQDSPLYDPYSTVWFITQSKFVWIFYGLGMRQHHSDDFEDPWLILLRGFTIVTAFTNWYQLIQTSCSQLRKITNLQKTMTFSTQTPSFRPSRDSQLTADVSLVQYKSQPPLHFLIQLSETIPLTYGLNYHLDSNIPSTFNEKPGYLECYWNSNRNQTRRD